KGEEQVTLLESIKYCFVSLDAPAAVHQASGSGSGAGPEASAPSAFPNQVPCIHMHCWPVISCSDYFRNHKSAGMHAARSPVYFS
ncbi:hypothetical protein Tco_0589574, partial [Tanacetum coccineum]